MCVLLFYIFKGLGVGCHFMCYIFCFGGCWGKSDTLLIIYIFFFLGGRVSLQVLVFFVFVFLVGRGAGGGGNDSLLLVFECFGRFSVCVGILFFGVKHSFTHSHNFFRVLGEV